MKGRSSSAFQSNGCCMDPALWQNFVKSGADLARQELVNLQKTPVHVPEGGDENEEEHRKSASREFGPPLRGGRNEGFPLGSVFDASMPPRNAGESNGDEFNSPTEGEGSGGRQVREKKKIDGSRSQLLEERCSREEKRKRI